VYSVAQYFAIFGRESSMALRKMMLSNSFGRLVIVLGIFGSGIKKTLRGERICLFHHKNQ